MPNAREDDLAKVIEGPLEDMGYDVVRIEMSGALTKQLQVMIERRDRRPINLDDCGRVSRTLSILPALDDAIGGEFALEISSAGIDRPLVKECDYERYTGFRARFVFDPPIDNGSDRPIRRIQARVDGVENQCVHLHNDSHQLKVPIHSIRRAQLIIDDELIAFRAKEENTP